MPDSSPSPSRDFQIHLSSTLDDLVDDPSQFTDPDLVAFHTSSRRTSLSSV